MRILQVAHVFPPESTGGTEVHTHLLSRALQAGHEVAVCYRVFDKGRSEHELVQGRYDGIPVYRLVNNFTWVQSPDLAFFDPGLEPAFETVLDLVGPELVHFHHLGGGLSSSFPSLVRRRSIPMLLTLHDFWPMCHRSHLLTSDGRLCAGPESGLRCVQCWLEGAVETKRSVPQRVRELGVRDALKLAPRFILDRLGLREHVPPVAYHTIRLMARDLYFRRLLEQFEILLAPSQFLKQRYVNWGVLPERIRVLQNGVDPTRFEGVCRHLPLGAELQAAYVGSILRYKGLDVLIDAFNQLSDVPVRLDIYGDTESTPDTKKYADTLRSRSGNPRVSFKGGFANCEIGKVLSKVDLVIVPSILYENCPMIILEALYAGRPVIASNIGGMAELVQDGVNGLTFRVGDANDLAERVRFLAENRQVLLACQDRIVPPRTIDAVAADIEACYEELVAARRPEG